MSKERIYLDYAAATPIFPEVAKTMNSVQTEFFGNPSSVHSFGKDAANLIESSKQKVAEFLSCQKNELYFTGSGTESNNLALLGVAKANRSQGNHIITTKIEHPSILNACKALEKDGFEITYLSVEKTGLINLENLKGSIKKETILVATHLANSEIGVIQPIKELSKITQEKGVYLHVDACQATVFEDLNVEKLGADLLSFNGSKAYGPRGIAVLFVREGVDIFPIQYGGGQQQGLRSGTENLPGIVGLAKALDVIKAKRVSERERIAKLRDTLQSYLEAQGYKINVKHSPRLSNHLSAIFTGDEANVVKYFDQLGIAVSSGSACSSTSLVDSQVLTAIGLSADEIGRTARISLGYQTTIEEIALLKNL